MCTVCTLLCYAPSTLLDDFVVGASSHPDVVFSGMFTQVRLYVGDGNSTPPALLRLMMVNVRTLRCRCRRYGFLALRNVLSLLQTRPKCMTISLEYLRSKWGAGEAVVRCCSLVVVHCCSLLFAVVHCCC